MSKTTKNILYGIGTFVGIMVIMILVRTLIKGATLEEALSRWSSWLIAACCGVSAFLTANNRDQQKKDK